MESKKINTFEHILAEKGLETATSKSFSKNDLAVDLYAKREGKSLLFLTYRDYFFVHDYDAIGGGPEKMLSLHEKAREVVNAEYKMPKALRMTVPNIATILVSENGFSEDMIEAVKKNTRSFVGGEYHAMYLIDLKNKQFYSQGIHLMYIPGEAKLVFGHRKEFKKIDPQNRMHHLIKECAEEMMK
jgi:hypothetical protein